MHPRHTHTLRPLPLLAVLLALTANAALAGEGVLEINQTCARETGCFPGDDPGFPVTIGQRGSYRLTSDLTVSGLATSAPQNVTVVSVEADAVTIDLGGFTISCQVILLGADPCSTRAGSGSGIQSFDANDVTVLNGKVRGMSSVGVRLGGDGGQVIAINASDNGDIGIAVADGGLVRNSIARANGGTGIFGRFGCLLASNVVRDNGGDGIRISSGCVVRDNAISGNAGNGIEASNGGHNLVGNAIHGNTLLGLSLAENVSGTTGYALNTLTSNGVSNLEPQVSGGTEMGGNACGFDGSCP